MVPSRLVAADVAYITLAYCLPRPSASSIAIRLRTSCGAESSTRSPASGPLWELTYDPIVRALLAAVPPCLGVVGVSADDRHHSAQLVWQDDGHDADAAAAPELNGRKPMLWYFGASSTANVPEEIACSVLFVEVEIATCGKYLGV